MSDPSRSNGFDQMEYAKEMGYDGVTVTDNKDGGQHVTYHNDVGRVSVDYDKDGNAKEGSYHEEKNKGWRES